MNGEESIDRSETLVKECISNAKPSSTASKNAVLRRTPGGATFPTHVKLSPPPGMAEAILIINAVSAGSYLTSDHRLMMEKGEGKSLVGVEILRKAINVERAVISIENKPDAVKHMAQLATDYPAIEICPLKVKYPQGGEKQLIDAVIRRQFCSALPTRPGAVVTKCRYGICRIRAVQKHKPLVERIVTITGKSLLSRRTCAWRIGTPISRLIDMCGGLPQDTEKVISGGHDGKSRHVDRHGNDKIAQASS